jgi:betaine-aldehyde dehydrogenase
LYAEFVERLVAAAQALRHGAPDAEDTTLGPIISQKQQRAVLQRISAGQADGARLLTGGTAIQGLGGFAVAPTVFTEAEHSTALWQEEVFGPVACVRPIQSDALAAECANDNAYGLVATIVSGDVARARRLATQLDVGMVWVNTPQLIFPQTSWGGFKHSSLGRELGPWGLQAFQEVRHTVSPR